MNKIIEYKDRSVETLFIEDYQGLNKAFGLSWKKKLKDYLGKDNCLLFTFDASHLLDYFQEESYGFTTLNFDEIIEELGLKEDDSFVIENAKDRPMMTFMSIEDNDEGYIYFLVKPDFTYYCALELFLRNGKNFQYAFSINGERYVVILWHR